MESSKIKNIIIIILLGLNIFLLALVLLDRAEARQADSVARDAIEQALESNGLSLSSEVDFSQEAGAVYSLKRDMEQEQELVQDLIGSCSAQDLGGNIRYYVSDSGQASARGTGEIDVLLDADSFSLGRDAASSAASAMKRLGMQGVQELATVTESGSTTTVELPYSFESGTIFNSEMTFTYSDGSLMLISGVRLFDVSTRDGDYTVMNGLTAAMRFIEAIRSSGYVCSELSGLEAGYVMSVTVSGEATLTPVWRFVTDAGSIYINAVTGQTESV